jgi:hypothetical protein
MHFIEDNRIYFHTGVWMPYQNWISPTPHHIYLLWRIPHMLSTRAFTTDIRMKQNGELRTRLKGRVSKGLVRRDCILLAYANKTN